MTTDLLQGAQTRRLVVQREHGWTLEVETLVRRYGSVYRPSVRRIQGMDVILRHLHTVRAERLAEHAQRLMSEVKAEETTEQSFEPIDDEWVPSSLLKTNPPALGSGEDPELAAKLAALDRENRNLRARLKQIESMIHSDADQGNDPDGDVPKRLSNAPPANEQAPDRSPLAMQGTMMVNHERLEARKPIPLDPMPSEGEGLFGDDGYVNSNDAEPVSGDAGASTDEDEADASGAGFNPGDIDLDSFGAKYPSLADELEGDAPES